MGQFQDKYLDSQLNHRHFWAVLVNHFSLIRRCFLFVQPSSITEPHRDFIKFPSFSIFLVSPHEQPSFSNEPRVSNDAAPPMAGFGFGLPISRLYAQYFGGDLQLVSPRGAV